MNLLGMCRIGIDFHCQRTKRYQMKQSPQNIRVYYSLKSHFKDNDTNFKY